MYKRNVVELNI